MVNWIYVIDKEAIETDMFLMVWLDAFGLVVRSTRTANGFQNMFNGMFSDGAWVELEEWQDADIGEQYRPAGMRGRLYFRGDVTESH
jgi:hypothetical protein